MILKRDKAAWRRFLVQIIENRVILRQMISEEKQARANTGLIHTIFMRITHNICCRFDQSYVRESAACDLLIIILFLLPIPDIEQGSDDDAKL